MGHPPNGRNTAIFDSSPYQIQQRYFQFGIDIADKQFVVAQNNGVLVLWPRNKEFNLGHGKNWLAMLEI